MLSINEIKLGKILKINNEPFIVIKTDHHKMGRGGAVLKTKLKNLINGNVLEKTFQGNDKADTAQTEKKDANFLYKNEDEAYFMDNTSYEQFSLPLETIGDNHKFLKEGVKVDVLYYNENPVSVSLPVKVDLKVISAPPGVKGNTASNVNKTVELETGAEIQAPLFVNEGDTIRINTETGEYVERV
ncbi:MAG: elongation factor P [Candidatus Falkowbacteria bacterium]|nr:elongation factor P [Candidatus Falkowbacteria bacterium]